MKGGKLGKGPKELVEVDDTEDIGDAPAVVRSAPRRGSKVLNIMGDVLGY